MMIFNISRLLNFARLHSPGVQWQMKAKTLHATTIRRYPDAPTIPLPTNYAEIINNETSRFCYDRHRDMSTPIRLYAKSLDNIGPTIDNAHLNSYDCFGMVSLNASMQSNVPRPYSATGKSTHLNMPGGGLSNNGKFVAQDIQNAIGRQKYFHTTTNCLESVQMTKRERLALAFKQYGRIIIIFHITISLMNLGGCYLAVISGLDVEWLAGYFFTEETHPKLFETVKTSTNFIVAYTIHKLTSPIRISLTLLSAPFIMKILRRKKISKPKPT